MALRNCSEDIRREVSIYVILVKEYMQSNPHLSKEPKP